VKLILLVALSSGLATIGLTPLVKRLAFVVGAVDHPGGRRKIHEREVPRLGGLAIFLPVTLSVVTGFWVIAESSQRLGGRELLALLVAGGCVFLLGVYDDIRGANAPVKLTCQIAAAGLLYISGVRISEVSTPFGWGLSLGIFALPFTLLWLVGLTNGMNLLDGMDGLAAGVGAISALTILIIATNMGDTQIAVFAAALLGSLLGFLWFNFHPAQIFLGDCGALFLGFFLAAISVLGNQKSASAIAMGVPIIALGIPIFDTSFALIRRLLRGKHPFQADRDHVHHRLLALGLSQPQVAIILYAVSALLASLAVLMTMASRAVASLIVLCLVLVVIAAAQRLRVGEFGEIVCLVQYGERRRRPPRYRAMLVRNALPLLERCETSVALLALLEEIMEDLGFDTLQVRVERPSEGECEAARGSPAAQGVPDCGTLDIAVQETSPFRNPDLVKVNGTPSWSGTASIFVGDKVVGRITATKPAWKRRRASENDNELLEFLADGVGRWIAAHQEGSESRQPAPANPPRLAARLLNGLRNGRPPRRSG